MFINLKINNTEDINFLSKFEEGRKNKIIETAITIGLKSIQIGEVNLDCHSYIEPIEIIVSKSTEKQNERLELIEDKLNDLLHVKSNSSRKGKLGENICRHSLIQRYPEWDFIDVSQAGYEADCRANKTPIGTILYEFKNYDYNVNREQIIKFVRDLDHTNINYGVFVSNTSGIVGKKNIEWEIIENKLIVYVSNMGLNGYGCIIGTELLVSLVKIGMLDKNKNWIYSNNYELKNIVDNISDSLDDLKNNIESYTKHKELIFEQRLKINSCFDILEKSSFLCLLNLNKTFSKILSDTQNFNCENKILSTNLDAFIKKLGVDKVKSLVIIFIEMCRGLEIYNDDNNIYVKKDTKLICRTKFLKNKIDIIFPIYHKNLQLNIDYEKIRDNNIIIEFKNDINILKIIETRLNV